MQSELYELRARCRDLETSLETSKNIESDLQASLVSEQRKVRDVQKELGLIIEQNQRLSNELAQKTDMILTLEREAELLRAANFQKAHVAVAKVGGQETASKRVEKVDGWSQATDEEFLLLRQKVPLLELEIERLNEDLDAADEQLKGGATLSGSIIKQFAPKPNGTPRSDCSGSTPRSARDNDEQRSRSNSGALQSPAMPPRLQFNFLPQHLLNMEPDNNSLGAPREVTALSNARFMDCIPSARNPNPSLMITTSKAFGMPTGPRESLLSTPGYQTNRGQLTHRTLTLRTDAPVGINSNDQPASEVFSGKTRYSDVHSSSANSPSPDKGRNEKSAQEESREVSLKSSSTNAETVKIVSHESSAVRHAEPTGSKAAQQHVEPQQQQPPAVQQSLLVPQTSSSDIRAQPRVDQEQEMLQRLPPTGILTAQQQQQERTTSTTVLVPPQEGPPPPLSTAGSSSQRRTSPTIEPDKDVAAANNNAPDPTVVPSLPLKDPSLSPHHHHHSVEQSRPSLIIGDLVGRSTTTRAAEDASHQQSTAVNRPPPPGPSVDGSFVCVVSPPPLERNNTFAGGGGGSSTSPKSTHQQTESTTARSGGSDSSVPVPSLKLPPSNLLTLPPTDTPRKVPAVSPRSRVTAVEPTLMSARNINNVKMFSLEEPGEDLQCPICALCEELQSKASGKMPTPFRYYAVGWLPEILQQWQFEHAVLWTIEERILVATALTNKPKLAVFNQYHHQGLLSVWKKAPFWKHNWMSMYAVIQGVFLYIFKNQYQNTPLSFVFPLRGVTVDRCFHSGKTYCLKLVSIGCSRCVNASEDELIEQIILGFDSDEIREHWCKIIEEMSMTCPHKCSSKLMNEVHPICEIAEALLNYPVAHQTQHHRKLTKQ